MSGHARHSHSPQPPHAVSSDYAARDAGDLGVPSSASGDLAGRDLFDQSLSRAYGATLPRPLNHPSPHSTSSLDLDHLPRPIYASSYHSPYSAPGALQLAYHTPLSSADALSAPGSTNHSNAGLSPLAYLPAPTPTPPTHVNPAAFRPMPHDSFLPAPTMLHGSPISMYSQAQQAARASLDFGQLAAAGLASGPSSEGEDDNMLKRKRASMPSPLGSQRVISGSGEQSHSASMSREGDAESDDEMKRLGKRSSLPPTLTSCEACRKGKRRCEPSPLVPPDHPDVARLPCARCRRFALECVRQRVTRRKGPAPVDLSAISDAVHGFAGPGEAKQPDSAATLVEQQRRRSSTTHEPFEFAPTHVSGPRSDPPFPILDASPSMSLSALPDNLDQVISHNVMDNIISLFFDYVYPLTPILHRPTFLANLAARKDKVDPVFFSLVLSVIASTLVQVPRSLVNLEKGEVENLARRCIRVSRGKMSFVWEEVVPVQSDFIVIAYLEGIVHLLLGNNTAHVTATAQANQLALAMRLNEESSYDSLDPIECEMRRRMFWLLFQADKSTACLRARTIALRLEDAAALRLPSEVDDEQITAAGILPQPIGRTPLISGFNIATHLFRILNDALLLQRRKTPPTVDSILADLQNVNELRGKVLSTTHEAASPLRLRKAYDSRLNSPAQDWEVKLQERFLDFFQSAGTTEHALNSFMVMQVSLSDW